MFFVPCQLETLWDQQHEVSIVNRHVSIDNWDFKLRQFFHFMYQGTQYKDHFLRSVLTCFFSASCTQLGKMIFNGHCLFGRQKGVKRKLQNQVPMMMKMIFLWRWDGNFYVAGDGNYQQICQWMFRIIFRCNSIS